MRFKRVLNGAKMVFECKRVKNEDVKGFEVQTTKELSYKGCLRFIYQSGMNAKMSFQV